MKFPSKDEKILPGDIVCEDPPLIISLKDDEDLLNRIKGSFVGLAIGDALGAHVEFRPRDYLVDHPVRTMEGGGTWGLDKGKWTDDTSMAICLALSLIDEIEFNLYDQFVRYKWWFRDGYMSSTGHCFDIGQSTFDSIQQFIQKQNQLKRFYRCRNESEVDHLSVESISKCQKDFLIFCGKDDAAGNGSLMRIAPIPLRYYETPRLATTYAELNTRLTHKNRQAIDASRYFSSLIIAALRRSSKNEILNENFLEIHSSWFEDPHFHPEIHQISRGSFKKREGYDDGIRGKGFVVKSLEAALWAFWSTENFRDGALAAVNLGDDTDTTAAIYGQLAGAYYGYDSIPVEWLNVLYAKEYLQCLSKWIYYRSKEIRHVEDIYLNKSTTNEDKSRDEIDRHQHLDRCENEAERVDVNSTKEKSFHRTISSSSSTSRSIYENRREDSPFFSFEQ